MRFRAPAVVISLCLLAALPAMPAQGLRPEPGLDSFVETDAVHPGTSVLLALRVELPDGVHVQSNQPRDSALFPTKLTVSPPAGITVEEILYPKADDLQQSGQAQPLAVFASNFVLGVRIRIPADEKPQALEIRGKLNYQACDEQVCFLPASAEISWSVPVVGATAALSPRNEEIFAQLQREDAVRAPAAADLVTEVRAANDAGNLTRATALVDAFRKANGDTPDFLLAKSWLARGALAAGEVQQAEREARESYDLVRTELKRRKLDDDEQLPSALGNAIDVLANAAVARGSRSEAVSFLDEQLQLYGDTSIHKRIQKDINLLTMEGKRAPTLDLTEYQGITPPTLASLQGRVVLLFFWAHWCSDCKAEGPILEKLEQTYAGQGLSIVAPTQRYGYVADGAPAGPEEETRYIAQVRQQYYPWLADVPVPLSAANHLRYGVSSTPTLVLVDRQGIVRLYHPGRMSAEELEPLIRSLL